MIRPACVLSLSGNHSFIYGCKACRLADRVMAVHRRRSFSAGTQTPGGVDCSDCWWEFRQRTSSHILNTISRASSSTALICAIHPSSRSEIPYPHFFDDPCLPPCKPSSVLSVIPKPLTTNCFGWVIFAGCNCLFVQQRKWRSVLRWIWWRTCRKWKC